MDKVTLVVIINYNAGDALLRSVASVLATHEPLRLKVADNASNDGSCEKLRSRYAGNPRIAILENAENIGFARAVNACVKDAGEAFLLILNPDCELIPGALAELKNALEQDTEAALAAPKVVDRNENMLRGSLRSFPNPWKALMTASGFWRLAVWIPRFRGVEMSREKLPDETCRVEAVSGACMLVRNDVFKRLGGFDEGFGLHFEDLDLMYRLRLDHQYALYVPSARAFHQPGTSSRSRPWWVHQQKHRGMQRFFTKHYYAEYSQLKRVLLNAGIWMHYVATLPLVLLRR